MSNNENHISEFSTYLKVWVVLLVLTAVNIFLASMKTLPGSQVMVLLGSCLQAFIALVWFMHLKYDNKLLRILVFGVFFLFFITVAITFLDYKFR